MSRKKKKLLRPELPYLTTITVLGKDYEIYEDPEMNQFAGLCFQQEGIILLKPEANPKERLHTLIHELSHAVSHRSGWNQAISSEIEEVIVESIATMIVEVFGEAILDVLPPRK